MVKHRNYEVDKSYRLTTQGGISMLENYMLKLSLPCIFSKLTKIMVIVLTLCGHNFAATTDTTGALVKIAQAFIGGAGSLNIESATLGIDKGIIANTVIGIGRSVERNPNPKGSQDHYLVKDRMKLGFELGAGLVAAGTITYAQEWTLVYPVSKKMTGLLSREFIVDLFLFYRASKMIKGKLPGDYALLRESSIEGKGRLKVGGTAGLLLGTQGSISKIKLETILIKASGKQRAPLKVMRQRSMYRKLAYELWMNLVVFDLPLFDASNESGTLEREYYESNYSRLDKPKKDSLIRGLFSGREPNILKNFKISRVLTSKFKEISLDFSIFFAFDRERKTRIDDVTDTIVVTDEAGNTQTASSRSWQWENRGNHEWTSGIRSEQYKSRMFLTGLPQENEKGITTNILNPQLKIQLDIIDDQTTKKEMNSIYWPLLQNFADQKQNQLNANQLTFSSKPESRSTIEIQFNKLALTTILETKEEDWYDALSLVTKKKIDYWQNSASNGLHSRDRRRLRQTRLPLGDIQLATQVRRLILATKKARLAQGKNNGVLALRHLLRGLRSSFSIGLGAFDTRLLRVVNSIVDQQNIFTSTKLQLNLDDQLLDYSQTRGQSQWEEAGEYQFLFEDPSEIYFFFEERLNP